MRNDEDFWEKEAVELMADNNFKDVQEKYYEHARASLKSHVKKNL
jgi:hypothetical protein